MARSRCRSCAIPPEVDPTQSSRLAAKDQAGNELVPTVTEADGETTRLDADHPQASADLILEIEQVEVL